MPIQIIYLTKEGSKSYRIRKINDIYTKVVTYVTDDPRFVIDEVFIPTNNIDRLIKHFQKQGYLKQTKFMTGKTESLNYNIYTLKSCEIYGLQE